MRSSDISSWDEFEGWVNALSKGNTRLAFRGHRDYEWPLVTTLERFILKVHCGAKANVRDDFARIAKNLAAAEMRITSEFKRGAHHFSVEPLDDEDEFGWLALMQHFGAPSRLLDWTESPYAAAYFAVEDDSRCGDSAVFAVDLDNLEIALNYHLEAIATPTLDEAIKCLDPLKRFGGPKDRTKSLNDYLRLHSSSGVTGIVAARPFKMNQRLMVQCGLFLAPLSLSHSFEDQLSKVLSSYVDDPALFRVRLKNIDRTEFLKKFDTMNVHHASLFPDLEGYAQSLRKRYEIKRLGDVV